MPPPKPPAHEAATGARHDSTQREVPTGSSVDEMSEASFPASDAPAVWTWDVPAHSTAKDAAGAPASSGEQAVHP
jgi:hypothetical protein